MANHEHNNPVVSVLFGSVFGISAFLQNHGYMVDNFVELFKVICFGLIGGACGYIGKNIAFKAHKYAKDKSKDICE